MPHGIYIHNGSDELVLSSDTYFPVYLGVASVSSTTQPTGGGPGTAATGNSEGGSSLCTYSYSGQIVPVLALSSGYRGAIYGCSQSGSTWSIRVSYTDGTQNSDVTDSRFAMYTQTAPTVHVFGFPTSLGGTWGGAIYNSAGTLVGDLTRRPLTVMSRNLTSTTTASLAQSFTLPGICGRTTDITYATGPTGVPETARIVVSNAIWGVSGTTLTRYSDRRTVRTIPVDDGLPAVSRTDTVTVVLTECSGL